MRALMLCAGLAAVGLTGCGERVAKMEGPTVKKFTGKVVADGKPVQFGDGAKVVLNVTTHGAQRFGIPIKADGTFDIGEMPIGKYSGTLSVERETSGGGEKGGKRSAPAQMVNIPGFEIKDGQSEYVVELGKGFKA